MTDIGERLRTSTLESAGRLTNGAFRRDGEVLAPDKRPRFSIPARPDRDDDLVLVRDIAEADREIERLRADLSTERELSLLYRMELVRIKRALLPFAEAGSTYSEADGVDVTNLGVEHYTAAHEAFHHEEPAPTQKPQEGRYMP